MTRPRLPESRLPSTLAAMKKPRPKISRRQRRRLSGEGWAGEGAAAPEAGPLPCPLCHRPMIPGPSLDRHHPLPRSHGGQETVTMHKICHRAIHAMLNERELAEDFGGEFADFAKLRAHPPLAQFVAWVRKRPPEYYDRTRWSKARRFK